MHANTIKLTVMELMITLPAKDNGGYEPRNPRRNFLIPSCLLGLRSNRRNRLAKLVITKSPSRHRIESSWKRKKSTGSHRLSSENSKHRLLDQRPICMLLVLNYSGIPGATPQCANHRISL